MKKLIAIVLTSLFVSLGTACSNTSERNANTNVPTTATAPATNINGGTAGANDHAGTARDDVPAIVRAALQGAQSVQTQHKDLSAEQVATIERETNTKIKDTDHHAYLGFSTSDGTRKQIGAATMVEANGKQMVIVYESRGGVPYIKEVRADNVPVSFLDQFKGKGHDDKLQLGQDLKANGVDEATAKMAADVIRQDTRIMQTLYGVAHGH